MIRRDFIKLMITSLASYPIAAAAQRSIPVVGALSPAARPAQLTPAPMLDFTRECANSDIQRERII